MRGFLLRRRFRKRIDTRTKSNYLSLSGYTTCKNGLNALLANWSFQYTM